MKYSLATRLVNELVEAADAMQLNRTIAATAESTFSSSTSWATWSSTAEGAEMLFQVLTEREEKASIAIGSNESFSGYLHRPALCAAIVDRLTVGGTIIETGTDSYRLAHTKQEAPRLDPR